MYAVYTENLSKYAQTQFALEFNEIKNKSDETKEVISTLRANISLFEKKKKLKNN